MEKVLFILLFILHCFRTLTITKINEFEEIEIVNDTQILSFNNEYSEKLDYNPEIIINCLNAFHQSELTSKLVISKTNKKSYILSEGQTIVLSRNDYINEGKGEYKLIFKNFIGGKIIIFNSIHSFPLSNFPKLINFNSRLDLNYNFNILLHSDTLKEDIYLSIKSLNQNLKIIKKNETHTEEINLENDIIKLNKGNSYNFINNISNRLYLIFHKIEINKYEKSKYDKFYIPYYSPVYYLINLKEFDNSIKDLYFYVYQNNYRIYSPSIELEIAEVKENIKEEDLNSIKYIGKKILDRKVKSVKFNDTLIESNYLLIKINSSYSTYSFFHIFEDALEISEIDNKLNINLEPKTETLLTFWCKNEFSIIISNNSNIKSFTNMEQNYFYSKYYEYYSGETISVSILPSDKSSSITIFSSRSTVKYLNNDYSLQNFLFPYFREVENIESIWFFYNNKNSILELKKHFGNPKFYYSNNLETLLSYQKDISVLNILEGRIKIEGMFYLYIYPNENTFIDILCNEIDNKKNIDFIKDDNVLKFLKKDEKYNLINIIEKIIRLEINQDLVNNNIKILDPNENIKYILNKDNPYIDLDESFNDFKIISDEDTYINIYHNISEIFTNEPINILEIKREDIEKGIIIDIPNIKTIGRFNYTMFYGYKNLIPSNLEILNYKFRKFYINNAFEKFDFLNENKNLYIYIFGNSADYSIKYINTYKLNNSNFYTKITPKKDYYFIPDKNYFAFLFTETDIYSYSYVELFFCRNDVNKNPMYFKATDAYGEQKSNTITSNYFSYRAVFKSIIQFDYEYEFILMSHENYEHPRSKNIDFFIPEVNNTFISLFIKSDNDEEDFNYTIIIIEENEDGDEIMNKLNNPCFFFQFFDKKFDISSEYNNIIAYAASKKEKLIYKEIDISKFNKNKNLFIKILSYSEYYKTIFYSKVKKIFIENIIENNNNIKENENNFGYEYIYDNKEYSISNDKYIFKYNIKKNHLGVL